MVRREQLLPAAWTWDSSGLGWRAGWGLLLSSMQQGTGLCSAGMYCWDVCEQL